MDAHFDLFDINPTSLPIMPGLRDGEERKKEQDPVRQNTGECVSHGDTEAIHRSSTY